MDLKECLDYQACQALRVQKVYRENLETQGLLASLADQECLDAKDQKETMESQAQEVQGVTGDQQVEHLEQKMGKRDQKVRKDQMDLLVRGENKVDREERVRWACLVKRVASEKQDCQVLQE